MDIATPSAETVERAKNSATDLAKQCQHSMVDAARKTQECVKGHPVLATIGLAAAIGAIVGVVFYKNHKHH